MLEGLAGRGRPPRRPTTVFHCRAGHRRRFDRGRDRQSPSSPTQETAVIHLEFSPEAARAFRAFTRDHLNTQIQIAVGSTIVAEPVIRSEIAAGRLEVHFTSPDEARAFAASLVQQ
ncbi:MAG: hypothetical protein IPM17_18755 [Verrucomicrobia bacterium]|nr:hypothetical protein [Verrucomicrobiota bacterium]